MQAAAEFAPGDGPFTGVRSATPFGTPGYAPANLSATPGDGEVALTWNSVPSATSYRVKRSTNSGGPYTQIATPSSTSYTDSTVTNGVTYYYIVSAANSYGESSNSSQISATPAAPTPGAPGTPSISNIAATSLTSTAPILPANATSLTLQKKLASQNDTFYTDVATGLAALAVTNVTNLTAETEYTFRYVAVGSGGSVAGNGVSATTLAATPDAPTVLSALAGNGVVDLSWQAANGAITYRVERSTVTEGPYSLVADDIDELTYSDTTVTNGTTYYYVVRGVNGAGNGPASNEASATPQVPAPAVPGAPSFSEVAQNSVKVTAPVLPSGADSLTLQKKLASDPDSSYANVDTGLEGEDESVADLLTANTTYSFRYVAVNAGGSNVGTSANVTTLPNAPAAPQNLDATPGDGEVDLTWEASSGAVTYAVHRSTIEGGPYTEIEGGLTGTSFNDDDVINGTTYYYVVTAINTGGSSANSGEASATPQVAAPAAPGVPSFGNITNTSVSVTMPTLPARAESLILQRKETGAGDETYIEVGEDPQAEDVVSVGSLSPATGYTFRVIAVNAGGSTVGTPAGMTTLPNAPAKPENLNATAGNAKIDLSWDAVTGATSYTVKRSLVANGPYSTIKSNHSGTTYEDTPLTNGVTQYYVVVAVNSGGSSPASDEASATPQVPAPAAPAAPTFSDITQTSVKVTAPELPAGAVTLTLQKKLASEQDSAYSNVKTGLEADEETPVTLLTANTAYSFRYIAVNAGGSTVGTPDNVTTLPNAPAKPEDLEATPGDGKVDLTWSASAGAVSYTVHYGTTQGGPYTEQESAGANTEFTHTPATNGTTYYYVVTATNTGGTSAASDEASATPQVAAPAAPGVPAFSNITSTGVSVTLPALPARADSLILQRKETVAGDETYTLVDDELQGAAVVSGGTLDPATGYTFRVIAVNAGGSTVGDPAGMTTLPNAPAKPEDLEATPGDEQIDLTWEASAGAVSYTLYSSTTEGGPYAQVQAGLTTTSYTHQNLTNGTEYFYVVRAVNTGGSSADSDEASATPQVAAPAAPDAPSFSNITSTGVSVTMPALPARATSLILQRKEKGAADNTYVEVGTNPQAETVVSGGTLTPSTEYTFRVVAVNAGGSTPGDPADMETLPNAPGAPQNVNAVGGNQQVALTWDALSGATSYQVQYATVTQGPYTLADGNVTTNSFTHTGLTNGTTYFYIVTASNVGGTGAASDEASATPTVAAPAEPGVPTFSEISSDSVKVHMPTLPVGATSFTLEQKLAGEGDETYITRQTGLGSGGTFVADELEPSTTYAFRVIAIGPGGSTAGEHATVETTSGDPDPDPDPQLLADLLVRGANDVEYIGDGLYSTAGAGQEKTQTVELDETAVYHVQIQNDSSESGSFVLSGNAALTGWTVKYYDALTGGNDITADITGLNGWSTGALAEDGTRDLRVEMKPTQTTGMLAVQNILLTVKSGTAIQDGVKLTTICSDLLSQPDLSIRRVAGAGEYLTTEEEAVKGEGVFNTNPSTIHSNQNISFPTTFGVERNVIVKIKNTGGVEASFKVTIPEPPTGWEVKFYDGAESTTEITTNAQGEGWQTPMIAPNAHIELKLSMKPTTAATDSYEAVVRAEIGDLQDAVAATGLLQGIAKLQWRSGASEEWTDVTPSTVLPAVQHVNIGLRAVKRLPNEDWVNSSGETFTATPQWQFGGRTIDGEEVWSSFGTATKQGDALQTVTALCGNSASAQARVRPNVSVDLQANTYHILATPGPAAKTQAILHTTVEDVAGNPVTGVKVRLTAMNSNEAVVGSFGAGNEAGITTTVDAEGDVGATWIASSLSGEVIFKAVVLDYDDTVLDASNVTKVKVSLPHTQIEFGTWDIDGNGNWSRSVKASVWFMGETMDGYTMTLTPEVMLGGVPVVGNVAPLDASSGTTNNSGIFTTIQRWNPPQPDDWPHDYVVNVLATLAN